MGQRIAYIAIVVLDYEEAIAFYTKKLHFTLVEDSKLSETKRWVLLCPEGSQGCCILLAKASNPEQVRAVGNQTGGRVFLFLHTSDFDKSYQNLLDNKVRIVRPPAEEPYGKVAVFADLYGNLWDMVEPVK
jgi:catechol 2,3-dioxygenase-like lactoylglutathione lyase family enzyme